MAKSRSYLRKRIAKTWRETEWVPVIIEDMTAGIIIAATAAILKICQWDEFKELSFLIIGTAILGFILGFIYRFVFITPDAINKEQERKIKALESKLQDGGNAVPTETEGSETKPARAPITVTLLFCLSAGLALLLVLQISKNTTYERRANLSKEPASSKPLPTKVIPRPEPPPQPPPVVTNQQVESTETQKPLEYFNAGTETNASGVAKFESAAATIARLKSEKEAKAKADALKINLEIQNNWDCERTNYQHALVVLHDALNKELTNGDGIVQSQDYFQCLPKTIDPKTGVMKVAQIGLQKNTNLEFLVTVTELRGAYNRLIIISGNGCSLEFNQWNSQFSKRLNVNKLDLVDDKIVSMDAANGLIFDSISDLIDAQKWSLAVTNTTD
jgi:hypothetical protein